MPKPKTRVSQSRATQRAELPSKLKVKTPFKTPSKTQIKMQTKTDVPTSPVSIDSSSHSSTNSSVTKVKVKEPTSESMNVFTKHRPIDNICQAAVRIQTKKGARNILEKDSAADLYIKTSKEGASHREFIYKRCRKTRKDGRDFCWKHYETIGNKKHPVVHFQRDLVEQLGKTVRKALPTDSYLTAGSISSRKAEEEKIESTQPIFSMKVNEKMLKDLVRIHEQIKDLMDRYSAGAESEAKSESESEAESESETEAEAEAEAEVEVEAEAKAEAEAEAEAETSDEETEVEAIYASDGTKYLFDEANMRIIELDGTILGKLYRIDHEEAPFCIKKKRYIVEQKTKINGKSHIRCKASNLVFDLTHKLIGSMIINDGKKRLLKI